MRSLEVSLRRQVRDTGGAHSIIITGDLFDSSALDLNLAIDEFRGLCGRLEHALGELPILVLPGNHDRRTVGVIGPHEKRLFAALGAAAIPRLVVGGLTDPFLSWLVPEDRHKLDATVMMLDTTFLPRGLFSAGGLLRQEDLLQVADQIADEPDRWLLALMHHHLIPTPITDLGKINASGQPLWVQFLLDRVLPAIVANADHEELTMTALGAGTALSTLHSLKRAVLVLHGHKHYPTARLLSGLREDDGDVLMVAAGSSGLVEPISLSDDPLGASLWPSFNLLTLSDPELLIETIPFSPDHPELPNPRRTLVRARREGHRWSLHHLREEARPVEPILARNEARYTLSPSRRFGMTRWDLRAEREVYRVTPEALSTYSEEVVGLPRARLKVEGDRKHSGDFEQGVRVFPLPMEKTLRYAIEGGIFRTVNAAQKRDPGAAFGYVSLMNRYASAVASVSLEAPFLGTVRAFASETDLATGEERTVPLLREETLVRLKRERCAARTLLRIYWPLKA